MNDKTHHQQQPATLDAASKEKADAAASKELAQEQAKTAETHKKERAIYERIVKKRNGKKRLSDAEKIILELNSTYDEIAQDEKDIFHALLNTLIQEDEAKAAERRQARARKKLIQDKLDKLHDTRARHKSNNALHVANKLYELGILNNDASYKIPAEIFYSFIKTNLHLLNKPLEQTPEKKSTANLEQAPQSTVPTPAARQKPMQQPSMQPESAVAPPAPVQQNSQQQPSSQLPNTPPTRQREDINPR